MDNFWLIVIVTLLIIGLIPAFIAQGKGKDFATWYIYGVCLFFFAMIHAIVLPEKSNDNQSLAQKVKESTVPLKELPASSVYDESLIVDLNSPVEMVSYKLKIPENYENAYVSITFRNLSSKQVAGIKSKILCYDAFNDPVKLDSNNVFEKSLQDLAVDPDANFGGEVLIELVGFADTRKIKVIITNVLFADGTLWSYNEDELFELKTVPLEKDEFDKLTSIAGGNIICYAREEKTYWQCVCGKANLTGADNCVRCKRSKQYVMDYCLSKEQVDEELQRRQEKQAEDDRIQKEIEKKRFKKLYVGLAVFVIITTAWISITYLIMPAITYNKASSLMGKGNYDDAINTFSEIRNYKDSQAKINDLKYRKATNLMDVGNYDAAITAFIELNEYRDSAEKIDELKYRIASALMDDKKYDNAISAFKEIKEYKDSKVKINEVKYISAKALMDDGNYKMAIATFSELKEYKNTIEILEQIAHTAESKGDYSTAIYAFYSIKDYNKVQSIVEKYRPFISAGNLHTVGIKSNGTAVAVGNHDYGRISVWDWNNLVDISAGVQHTVGLKSDGTVVTTRFARGFFRDWSGITAISAGFFHTVGLKYDGTVVATGSNTDGQLNAKRWSDIVTISAGRTHTVGLKPDGTVVAVGDNEEGQCNVGGWTDIVAISAGRTHTVGLKSDGTVVAIGDNSSGQRNVRDWRDIISVSAGGTHTVGLKSDGTVVAVGDNLFSQIDVGGWNNIVAISAGRTHTVGLKSDGTVVAVGSTRHNQCDVSHWSHIGPSEYLSKLQ